MPSRGATVPATCARAGRACMLQKALRLAPRVSRRFVAPLALQSDFWNRRRLESSLERNNI